MKNKYNPQTSKQTQQTSNNNKNRGLGQLRIIGGKWRGRKLPVIDSAGLRPTGDRVKETLFNWLMHDIQDATCLDLFAGSGSLGFEAASRYAEKVVMVERTPLVAKQIAENIRTIGAENIELFTKDALLFLQDNPIMQFDVIFLDPPFNQDLIQGAIDALTNQTWLKQPAWIYLESEKNLINLDIPNNWFLHREKVTGEVRYRLFRVE